MPITVNDQVDHAPAVEPDDVLRAFDIPEFPAASLNCESVMRWPIFSGLVPETQSLVLESGYDDVSDLYSKYSGDAFTQSRRGTYAKALQEDNFVPLSKRFLAYVHVKNPILEVASFKAHVKDAAENGLRWDGPSCLVVSGFQIEHGFALLIATARGMRAWLPGLAVPAGPHSIWIA